MNFERADTIRLLKREILALQGFRGAGHLIDDRVGRNLGPVAGAFPDGIFPVGAVHEFVMEGAEGMAATSGFLSGVLAALMEGGGAMLWVSRGRKVFPPALRLFGVEPSKIVFIDCKSEKDLLWVMEEALKCDSLTAVVGEVRNLSFTASRRLQLAVEQSKVTGFVVRPNDKKLTTTASVARWKVVPLPCEVEDGLPGLGFPKWQVELLRVRNGKAGSWPVEWRNGKFEVEEPAVIQAALRKIV